MLELEDVAQEIVREALDVGPKAGGVVGSGARNEVVGDGLALAAVLATFGLDQAVERIVGEALVGADGCVVREHHRLRQVPDLRDVADGVVRVAEVLVRDRAGDVGGVQAAETKRPRVVLVGRARAVAVVDALALAAGVVLDAGDEIGERDRATDAVTEMSLPPAS